ncbi:MAG: GNAT family N-acetyltransferase [Solirubrobacterales bacterium]
MEATDRLTVRPVRGRRDLTRFIKLPFRLHSNQDRWVPPLISERRRFLDRSRNPYFEHADAEYFLCERDGRPVGRITAQIDHRWDEFQGGSDGMFGFLECENDLGAARALVGAAAEWVRERGRERLVGPMDFTTNDECGVLIEGYERTPMILEPWHPPYYRELLESQGLGKRIDLLMWWLEMGDLKEGTEFHPMIHEAAAKAQSEHGVVLRGVRKRNLEPEMREFMDIYNEAWGDNWGFVPITDAEIRFQAAALKPILSEDWMMIAERDGEVLGAALTLPDVNQVLAKMGGRLLPLGWLRFLLGRRKIDRIRVFALGVRPEHQHLGVAAALFVRHLEASAKTGIPAGEMGWILETNEPMNRAMEGMGGKVVKKYRLYELAL